MTKYCEKLTGLLQEFNSGNELTAFDSLASGPAEKLQLQAKLEAKFEPIYELMREFDPYMLWNRYEDGEVVWDTDLSSPEDCVGCGEGMLFRGGATILLNGEPIGDYSAELTASGLGLQDLRLYSHPLGYMVSIGQDVWINGEKQPAGEDIHNLQVRSHPKGFVGYSHPLNFYLNGNEKINFTLPNHNVPNCYWVDKKGDLIVETVSSGVPLRTFNLNLYSSSKGRLCTSAWIEKSPYSDHPDGYLERRGKKFFLNGKKLIFISDVDNPVVLPYPGGVIVAQKNSKIPGKTFFVFHDGSSLPENQSKKSMFDGFINSKKK
jgi:hypothetical protein